MDARSLRGGSPADSDSRDDAETLKLAAVGPSARFRGVSTP
jgi:hypothetical protein